jgi:hypothetical protein
MISKDRNLIGLAILFLPLQIGLRLQIMLAKVRDAAPVISLTLIMTEQVGKLLMIKLIRLAIVGKTIVVGAGDAVEAMEEGDGEREEAEVVVKPEDEVKAVGIG